MLKEYRKHLEERAAENIPPLPLDAEQTAELFCRIVNSFKPIYDARRYSDPTEPDEDDDVLSDSDESDD